MNARKLPESSTFSEVLDSTSSQTTASEGRPARSLLGRDRHVGDLRVDVLDRDRAAVMDPELLQVGDHDARVLAGDVAQDRVALGLSRDAFEDDHVVDGVRLLEERERLLGLGFRRDDPQVDHAAAA